MIHPYSYYPGRAAWLWPEKAAFIEGEDQITYREFDKQISQMANALLELGIKKGERVAVVQQNTIPFAVSVCGIARAGAVFVPLLGILTEKDHVYMVSDSGARVVISTGEATDERALAINAECQSVEQVITHSGIEKSKNYNDILSDYSIKAPVVRGVENDLAQIIYTSGTTGKPKGVMHSYSSTQAAMFAWVNLSQMNNNDINLLSLPLSHFGARVMDSGWCVGTTGVIIPAAEPMLIMEAIQKHKAGIMLLVPTLLTTILNHPEIDQYDLSHLRFILYAAAPASAALVEKSTKRFGPVLHTGWGQSEAYGLNTHLSPREHEEAVRSANWRLISCGRESATGVQIRLIDEQGEDVKPGEIGQACIKADWQAIGYWNLPELTAESFVNGWFHTGDMLRYDPDGYYYVVDRKNDLIISGGYNIYPREIEEVLYSDESVLECAVIGVPDSKWGEAVKATVVIKDGMDTNEEELIALCKDKLASYKAPKSIDFLDEIPKTSFGKISRKDVKKSYWKDKDRQIGGAE